MLFLGAFVLMSLVGNFFGNLADVFTDWQSFLKFLQETALLLPLLLELIIPITVLLATIATYSSLNKNAELLAMRSSGIGGWRLAFPVLAVSALIASFTYFSQNYMYTWMHQTWVKQENSARLPPLWKVGEEQSIYYFGNRQHNGRISSITSFNWKQSPFQLLEELQLNGENNKTIHGSFTIFKSTFSRMKICGLNTLNNGESKQKSCPLYPLKFPFLRIINHSLTCMKILLNFKVKDKM